MGRKYGIKLGPFAEESDLPMLYIGSRDEIIAVDLSRVAYIKAEGYYSSFCYANGTTVLVSMGISRVNQLLLESKEAPANTFVRIGRSYIINMKLVVHVSLSKHGLRLSDPYGNECTLQLSKNELRLIANHFVKHYSVHPISKDTPQEY